MFTNASMKHHEAAATTSLSRGSSTLPSGETLHCCSCTFLASSPPLFNCKTIDSLPVSSHRQCGHPGTDKVVAASRDHKDIIGTNPGDGLPAK